MPRTQRVPIWYECLTFPNIEALHKRLGVLALAAQQDGVTPYYSVQLIYTSAGAIIPDSTAIAGYLNATYHDTLHLPPWCTSPTHSIHTCFWSPCQDFDSAIVHPCCLHHLESKIPSSQTFYKQSGRSRGW